MTTGNSPITAPSVTSRIPWHSWAILAAILIVGAGLRFHDLTKVGLWPDEFWSSVHLATGRGNAVLDLPTGVLVQSPPPTLLQGAPPWWHIWTGLKQIIHPPLYLILLRWWMDIFGTSDFSTRSFSALASLAGAAVLFDIIRKTVSNQAGLIAAALMAISPLQINLSQETRPYPLLILFGLLACRALLQIEREDPSPGRLFRLGLWTAATALTHYFSLGALAAIFSYALIRFRGPTRRKTLIALCASALFVLIVWGPFLWQQHREFFRQQSWSIESSGVTVMPLIRAAAIPSIFLYGQPETLLTWIAPCLIAYLLPLILPRRYPTVLLWWLWIVGTIGSIFVYDCINHARLLATIKYVALASPALYALCLIPLPFPRKWQWIISYLILISVALATVQCIQEGPSEANGDWRGMATTLDHRAEPNDPLIFYLNPFWGSPGMYYLAFAHYAHDSQHPIMYLNTPADQAALQQLAGYKRVWLVGSNAGSDGMTWLPGWHIISNRWFPNGGSFVEMTPGKPATSPSSPSRPEIPAH